MSNGSITSTNAVYILTVPGLFDTGQPLQGFSADDIFDTSATNPAEVSMGLDGLLSAGFVPQAIVQTITLQADSDSNQVFDDWFAAQQSARELYAANAIVRIPSLGKSYTLTRGFLTSYSPISDAKKTMQPRKYSITWQASEGAPA